MRGRGGGPSRTGVSALPAGDVLRYSRTLTPIALHSAYLGLLNIVVLLTDRLAVSFAELTQACAGFQQAWSSTETDG